MYKLGAGGRNESELPERNETERQESRVAIAIGRSGLFPPAGARMENAECAVSRDIKTVVVVSFAAPSRKARRETSRDFPGRDAVVLG